MDDFKLDSIPLVDRDEETEKIVLICSNCAWTIVNFRLPLINRLKNLGYRVAVVTQYDGYESQAAKYVDQIIPLFIVRKGINPFVDSITLLHLVKILLKLKPDYLLLFTIKPVIYGAIAAKFFNIKTIVMITGLGTAFIANNWITRLVKTLYRFALSSVSTVFFQNSDDKDLFISSNLISSDICKLTPGSGIDTCQFPSKSPPLESKITFILIARMIWDKGIGEYVEAAKIIKTKYPDTKFQLLGALGVENRTAISEKRIAAWVAEGAVEYLGETTDVRDYIEQASCVVLPSYREGTSRVLLEAASMARPIIASDVPGCREVVENGITGLLCRSKDCSDLSNKMEAMINLSFEERKIMGSKGRQKIEKEFNHNIVNDLYLDAIEN
jgi:glycosyltransferase involved in cell wall biosynthesis